MGVKMKQTAIDFFRDAVVEMVKSKTPLTTIEVEKIASQAHKLHKKQTAEAQMDMFHHINDLPFGMEYLSKRDSAETFVRKYKSKTIKNKKI